MCAWLAQRILCLGSGEALLSSDQGEVYSMTMNEGALDRGVRVVVGIILIALVFVGPKTSWGWIGLLPLITGIVGICPAYSLFGIKTCPVKKY